MVKIILKRATMLKRCMLLTLILISLVSASVLASANSIEEQWTSFIESVDLEYEHSHGKVELDFTAQMGADSYVNSLIPLYLQGGILLGYGIFPNMQVKASYNRDYFQLPILAEDYSKQWTQQYIVTAKYQILNQTRFVLAIDGFVTGLNGEKSVKIGDYSGVFTIRVPASGANLYSTVKLGERIVLFNNIGVLSGADIVKKGITNGLEFRFNENHALRVKSDIAFPHLKWISCTVSALYKSSFDKYFTLLLGVTKRIDNLDIPEPVISLSNTLETGIIPTVLLRGQFLAEKTDTFSITTGVEVEKKAGIFNLIAGYSYRAKLDGDSSGEGIIKMGLNADINFGLNRKSY